MPGVVVMWVPRIYGVRSTPCALISHPLRMRKRSLGDDCGYKFANDVVHMADEVNWCELCGGDGWMYVGGFDILLS